MERATVRGQMGHRLSRIYTRTGDGGETSLGDGSRVRKTHPRVEAFGTVDELNSVIGCLLTHRLPSPIRGCLKEVQHALFDLGGQLCIPGHSVLRSQQVTELEESLDRLNEDLEPLEEFILPGGAETSAVCHLARTVCRRAERRTVELLGADDDPGLPLAVQYLNRLSDLLFGMARTLNRVEGRPDVLWKRERS